nr:trace amine-associated receptor 8a-like [Nothobranchius furzeri]
MEVADLCAPELLNSSCRKKILPYFVNLLLYFVFFFMSFFTVTLNLLVIISISHFRQLHTSTNLLLLSLALSDFSVGFFMFFQLSVTDGCWYLGDLMCVLYYVLNGVITSVSVGNMVLISIDRYVAICEPLHYPSKVTPKRVQICVSLCWICSILYVIFLLRDNFKQPGKFNSCFGECVIDVSFINNITDFMLTFIIPITVVVLLYVRVFVVAVSQVQAMRSHTAAVQQKQSGKVAARRSELKAAGTLGIVILAFLFCLCPYYCVTLIGQSSLLNSSSMAFLLNLFYFNSCLNPMIYAFFYPWFRNAIKVIVTLEVLKSGSSDANIL